MILPNEPIISEIWRALPYNIFPDIQRIYLVSSYGRIHNLKTGNYLPINLNYDENKYTAMNLSTLDGGHRHVDIHRIVLMTFNYIPGCESFEVNHKDGIKHHNWLWNPEWSNPKDNMIHAIDNNLVSLGEDRDNAILNNELVHRICKYIEEGYSTKDICSMVAVPIDCDLRRIICNIKAGLSWKHISQKYDFSKASTVVRLFTAEQIHFMCKYFQDNGVKSITTPELLKLIGIDFNLLNKQEKSKYSTCVSSIRK